MQPIQTFVNRPVAVIMFYCGILLLGTVSLSRLSVDLLPDLTYPRLTVQTPYTDAVPEEVERVVTVPIEQTMATVPGIRRVRSVSREGLSLVIVEFNWGQNMDFASLNAREKLDAMGSLPPEIGKPTVIRLDPASRPFMVLTVTGRELAALKELCSDVFKRRLEQIRGVAMARVTGGQEKEIQILADPTRCLALGVTIDAIARAVENANIDMPGGTVLRGRYRYSLRTLGAFTDIHEIENVTVAYTAAGPVLLKDVARVREGFKERTGRTHYNGQESIGILLHKETGGNTVRVSGQVQSILEELRLEYPEIPLIIAYNQADFISQSIANVMQAILLGGILAFVVLFFFLHEWRHPLNIAAAIPISIIATFILLYFTGVGINLMSLGGLALGVGMLVDSSIVVLENIFRHRELGLKPGPAAVEGTREVAMAVTASTFTTIAVFLPVLYVKGVAGQLFKDQALTVTFSLLASLTVSLSLLPVLASRFGRRVFQTADLDLLNEEEGLSQRKFFRWLKVPLRWLWKALRRTARGLGHDIRRLGRWIFKPLGRILRRLAGPVFRASDRVLAFLLHHYETLLSRALSRRSVTLLILAAILILTAAAASLLPRELMPRVDQGEFTMELNLPPGTSLEALTDQVQNMEAALLKDPGVSDVFSNLGMSGGETGLNLEGSLNHAELRVRLKDGYATDDLMVKYRKIFATGAGRLHFGTGETVLSQILGGSDADVIIQITGDTPAAAALMDSVKAVCSRIPELTDLQSRHEEGRPEYTLTIDRRQAGRYGLSVRQVALHINHLMMGEIASQLKEFDRKTDIRVRPRFEEGKTMEVLLNQRIPASGTLVPLRELIQVRRQRGAVEILRENQTRTISLFADVTGKSLGQTVQRIEAELAGLHRPANTRIRVAGAREEMQASYQSLLLAACLALALVYMIMAAQFESFKHPFIIILSVPMAAVGTVWLLLLTGQSLNVVSLIGVVVLVGIAVNDAIVKVDFINQERRRGTPLTESLMEAGRKRFRPILMTSVTTILGLTPMAVGLGKGAELQRPLALAIIGGLITSTVLTLIMIPVIYSLLAGRRPGPKTNKEQVS